jgi:hypothetical protein
MRRIEDGPAEPCVDRAQFQSAWDRLESVGFPLERSADEAWPVFCSLRRDYAPIACQLLYWTIAAPAPWSGSRLGFPDITDQPSAPLEWSIAGGARR